MEYIYNSIKSFMLDSLPDYLDQVKSEDTPMPMVQSKNIVFGSVDVDNLDSKVVCAILPETQEDEESELSYRNESSNVVVTFIFSNANYNVLVRQMARYATAFRRCILDDPSLGGTVEDVAVGTRTFFTDAGTTEKQKTAVEIELTIYTEEEITD